jgi:hypothetical protein
MTDINRAIDGAVERIIQDFQRCPGCYFTEEDVRWRLMKEIEVPLADLNTKYVTSKDGIPTSLVHTEYPTPFRCSMSERRIELLDITNTKGQRGHFDIVVLNAEAAAECDFEILRSQYYKALCEKQKAKAVPLPLLDYAIELKLFRDLAHPNRTESAKQQAEYAVQAVKKLAATLESTQYYSKPFAKRGLVLLFDNSDLVCSGNAEVARSGFWKRFRELINWNSFPDALSCIWVTSQGRDNYRGRK